MSKSRTPPKSQTAASQLANSIAKSRTTADASRPNAGRNAYATGQGGNTMKPRVPQFTNPNIRNTKEYKSFARKWTSTIVALPILMVTSYMLYQRIFDNQEQRALVGTKALVAESTPPSADSPPATNPNDKV